MESRRILIWCHGSLEKQWANSGWLYDGRFYPCLYTDSKHGEDKTIGKRLLTLEKSQEPDMNPPPNSFIVKGLG